MSVRSGGNAESSDPVGTSGDDQAGQLPSLSEHLTHLLDDRSRLMLEYLTGQGDEHPRVEPSGSLPDLIAYYNALARSVKPATPRMLEYLALSGEAKEALAKQHGDHDRSAAYLTVAASVLAVLGIAGTWWSLSVLGTDVAHPVIVLPAAVEKGDPPLRSAKIVFDLSVAALGAVLTIYTQVQYYVTRWLYDKRYNVTYIAKFVSGLVAGVILAELLSGSWQTAAPASDLPNGAGDSIPGPPLPLTFGVGAAALIGGAFAPAVYNMIKRIADMAERIFEDRAAAREAAARKETELVAALDRIRGEQAIWDEFVAYRSSVETALKTLDPQTAEEFADYLEPRDRDDEPL